MPRRKQQKKVMAPYSFTLPGGSEFEALGTGYAFLREANARDRGYKDAAAEANRRLLKDTKNAYLVADLSDPDHGRLARAMSQPDLFDEYKAELMSRFPYTHAGKLHHDISVALKIKRGQKVSDGLPFEKTLSLRNDTLFITYTAAAQSSAPRAPTRARRR